MQEHSIGIQALRQDIHRLDGRIIHLEQRMDTRFEAVDHRIDRLDDKVSRQFVWLVGMQVTTLLAVVGALLARA